MSKRKVLIIAYYFPPLGGAGVQRILKFVKYLPEFGWEPVVLTVKPISYPALDESLMEEIPAGIKVFRTGSLDPQRFLYLLKSFLHRKKNKEQNPNLQRSSILTKLLRWLFVPDTKVGWVPFAFFRGLLVLKREKIDLIFSSSPPASAHLAAYLLSKTTGKPLVIDFRDPWNVSLESAPSGMHKRLNQFMERMIVKKAQGVVAVNQPILDSISSAQKDKPTKIIWNGYDPSDFEGLTTYPSEKFEIVYLGTFNRLHDPRPFLAAYSELLNENTNFAREASFTKVGMVLDWDWESLLREHNLERQVVSIGYLPHREGLKYLLKAKVLLLITHTQKGSELFSTGKIYEYLAARKPILAIVPENGAAAELIRKHNAGVVVNPGDKDQIKKELLKFYQDFKSGQLQCRTNVSDLNQYQRKNLTQALAQFFQDCSK